MTTVAGAVAGTRATPGRVVALTACLVACALPAWTGLHGFEWAASLFPRAVAGGVTAGEWCWLALWLPAVTLSAAVALCAPGLLFVLAIDAAPTVDHWLSRGFGATFVLVSAIAALVPRLWPATASGGGFLALLCASTIVVGAFAAMRAKGHAPPTWPLADPSAFSALVLIAVAWFALVIGFTPKLMWEAFNGDGAHGFESSRLLLFHAFPFWPPGSGHGVNFPGVGTMGFAYPASWFIRLFGGFEASARIPTLLFLPALHAALFTLIRHERAKLPGVIERALVWAALGVYTVAMCYSATWDPYSADMVLPAAEDTLLTVGLAGFLAAFLERRWGWALFLFALAYVSRPSAIMMGGLWLLAKLWLERPRPWVDFGRGLAVIAACVVGAGVFGSVIGALQLPPPGTEHGLTGLLRRFAFLQYAYVGRVLWLVVPCGILPALVMLAWRWLDRVSRGLVVFTLAYFALFYIQAYVMIHYFAPVMLLPLVVLWRIDAPVAFVRARPATALAGLVAAFWLSLPATTAPVTASREIGRWLDDRTTGYESMDPHAFRRADLLTELFPFDWQPVVPERSYGGSPFSWLYYAHRSAHESRREINYVLAEPAATPPDGMHLLARNEAGALYVRSDRLLAAHRAFRPPSPAGARIYQTPRGMLFHSVPLVDGPPIVEMKRVLEWFGLPVDTWLDRLGIAH